MAPYLKYLRNVLDDLGHRTADETGRARIAIARRLLDSLIARELSSGGIEAEMVAGLAKLAGQHERGACLASLLADSRQSDDFLEIARSLGSLQARLITSPAPADRDLARSIAGLERRFYQQIKGAAAREHAEISAGPSDSEAGAGAGRDFDRAALEKFLRSALDEPELTIAATRYLAGGFSKWTLGITLSGVRSTASEIVLRSDSTAVHSAGSVVAEYALLCALHERGLRVPRPLASEATGSVFGAPFIVVEKCQGSSPGSLLVLPPRDPELARDTAIQLARLHTVPLDAIAPAMPPATSSATEWVAALVAEDYDNWKALGIPSSLFEAAFAWLRANVHLNDGAPRVPMHGDYGMQNILVENSRVMAVLDWEFACIGHAAYDLGYFYDQAESMGSWKSFLEAYASAGAAIPDETQLDYNILLCAAHFGVMSLRLRKHVEGGGGIDEAAATVIGHNFTDEFSERAARTLEKVLSRKA